MSLSCNSITAFLVAIAALLMSAGSLFGDPCEGCDACSHATTIPHSDVTTQKEENVIREGKCHCVNDICGVNDHCINFCAWDIIVNEAATEDLTVEFQGIGNPGPDVADNCDGAPGNTHCVTLSTTNCGVEEREKYKILGRCADGSGGTNHGTFEIYTTCDSCYGTCPQ